METCPIKFKVLETSDEFNFEEMEKNIFSKANKNLFKEYYKYFDPQNIELVNFLEEVESEEEVNLRIEKEEKIIMDNWMIKVKIEKEKEEQERQNNPKLRNKKNYVLTEYKPPVIELSKEPMVFNKINVSDIDMSIPYCDFSKWVASVFQNIKDLKINDVNDVCIIK
jgi:hypothetical protein